MRKTQFTVDDFMSRLDKMRDFGPWDRIMRGIPGMSELTQTGNVGPAQMEAHLDRMQAIYRSMTKEERQNISFLDGDRHRRIARGADVELKDVSEFVKQFEMFRRMMRAVNQLRGG